MLEEKICFAAGRADYFDSNFKDSQALFWNISSQPCLNIRITQEAVKSLKAQTAPQINYIRISGVESNYQIILKLPHLTLTCNKGENH